MNNVAKDIVIPEESGIFRIVFLYVGQGDATLLVVPDGKNYKYILIDSNTDETSGGIDILKFLKDLFDGEAANLDIYINTHPHNDHTAKIKEIYEEIGFNELWHSGHKPGGDNLKSFEGLEYVMDKLGDKNVFCLKGSEAADKLDDNEHVIGDIQYNVLSPAEYVSDDIEGEKPEARYQRIHEQCGVIKFSYGKDEKQILITGDADYSAWKNHITDYHKDRLPATVLSAAHHGSNSFFYNNSDTQSDLYKDHIDKIDPTYIVVSAPTSKDSKHDHPHKEAMDLYEEQVGVDCVFHLGDKRECIIFDIDPEGEIDIYPDDELVKKYGPEGNNNSGNAKKAAPAIITRIDRKPMGR